MLFQSLAMPFCNPETKGNLATKLEEIVDRSYKVTEEGSVQGGRLTMTPVTICPHPITAVWYSAISAGQHPIAAVWYSPISAGQHPIAAVWYSLISAGQHPIAAVWYSPISAGLSTPSQRCGTHRSQLASAPHRSGVVLTDLSWPQHPITAVWYSLISAGQHPITAVWYSPTSAGLSTPSQRCGTHRSQLASTPSQRCGTHRSQLASTPAQRWYSAISAGLSTPSQRCGTHPPQLASAPHHSGVVLTDLSWPQHPITAVWYSPTSAGLSTPSQQCGTHRSQLASTPSQRCGTHPPQLASAPHHSGVVLTISATPSGVVLTDLSWPAPHRSGVVLSDLSWPQHPITAVWYSPTSAGLSTPSQRCGTHRSQLASAPHRSGVVLTDLSWPAPHHSGVVLTHLSWPQHPIAAVWYSAISAGLSTPSQRCVSPISLAAPLRGVVSPDLSWPPIAWVLSDLSWPQHPITAVWYSAISAGLSTTHTCHHVPLVSCTAHTPQRHCRPCPAPWAPNQLTPPFFHQFLRHRSHSVAQAGVQWCDLSSLQPLRLPGSSHSCASASQLVGLQAATTTSS
ncbi:hypothetical protein AAY473_011508 [Plecturocebus cupreus]